MLKTDISKDIWKIHNMNLICCFPSNRGERNRLTPTDQPFSIAYGWESNMHRQQSLATILIGKSVLIREGIAKILHAANFRILASASCVEDLSAGKFQQHQLLFLIVHTDDHFDSVLEQVELLREKHPNGCIAIVAAPCRQDELVSVYRAGVKGYFANEITCDVFIKSVELVMMGETIFPPAILACAMGSGNNEKGLGDKTSQAILFRPESTTTPQLSPRERLILHHLIEGNSNKSIARKVDIAEATVKVHVKAILRKIRVQNRTQAAIWAMNNGGLAKPIDEDSVPTKVDAGGRFEFPLKAISEVRRIGVSDPPSEVIIHRPNHVTRHRPS
jgi:DNA-binding NarL/FixJ family response regulator